MLIGYARVSTQDQDTAIQEKALKDAGCERIFLETASGGRWERPELQKLLEQLRPGDVLIVWKLDRLSRSLRDVITILDKLDVAKCGFRSLTETIDTTTAAGKMMMQVVATFAEFERNVLRERTMLGIAHARREGRTGGRKSKLSKEQQREVIRMVKSGDKTAADTARLFQVDPSTICRMLLKDAERQKTSPKEIIHIGSGRKGAIQL